MFCGDQRGIGESDQPPTPQRKPVHHGGAGVGVDRDDELHYHARDTMEILKLQVELKKLKITTKSVPLGTSSTLIREFYVLF